MFSPGGRGTLHAVSRLPERIRQRLRVPLIAAPMLRVSGVDLMIEVCRAGAIGSFPTANARTPAGIAEWLTKIERAAADAPADLPFAPHCPNLIIRQPALMEHLEVLVKHRVEMVITSVGSPKPVVKPLHDAGAFILSDVATVEHAKKAIDAGVDGLVLLTAGAGGQTGWLNGFAFVRAVRKFYDGPLVMAGGISDGRALAAAMLLGCDLGYMGTGFIASNESMASPDYKDMLVTSTIDDILLTRAFTGLRTSMLMPAILKAGIDPKTLDENMTAPDAEALYGANAVGTGPKRWQDIFSAGHSVSGVEGIYPAHEIVERVRREYEEARK